MWDGDFNDDNRADILFFYPGDKNWWLGSYDGKQLQWKLVGNTSRFGNAPAGCLVWNDDFDGDGQTDILFFYSGDKNWWLGSYDGNQLQWSLVGNTASFGSAPQGRPVWNGDFNGDGQADILFHNPPDGNWWLGSHDGNQLRWSSAGNTSNFGNGGDGRPFFVGDFNGDEQTDMLFYYPPDGNWWLGSHNGSRLNWSLAGNFSNATPSKTISGKVTNRGVPLNGIAISLTGSQAASAITNGSGDYSFTVAAGGNYDVAPKSNYNFSPPKQTFNNLVANQIANFTVAAEEPPAPSCALDERVSPAVARNSDGRLEVFVRCTDGNLWHKYQLAPNSGWSEWENLGGYSPRAQPVVGRNADGRLEVFVRGTDGNLWHMYQVAPNSGWSGWTSLGGYSPNAQPAVGTNADGRMEVFTRGTDGALWHMYQFTPNRGWSGWARI